MKENQKYPLNAVRLCIDQTDGEVSGRAYTPLYAGELQFMGLQELLLRLDRIFDESGYPHVRRRITIGCNSKLKSRLTSIRPRGLACNCTFLSA